MAREKIRRPPQLTLEETRHYQQVVKELAEEGVPQERLRQEYREYLWAGRFARATPWKR